MAREVTVNYDLVVLEQVARELGLDVNREVSAIGWEGTVMCDYCDLVIRDQSDSYGLDMGFRRNSDGTVTLFADNHEEAAQTRLYSKLIPRYLERMIENDSRGRYRVQSLTKYGSQIVMTVNRR